MTEKVSDKRALTGAIPYDAWLHWEVTEHCNLNCEHCFTHGRVDRRRQARSVIDISALMRSLDAAGQTFRFQFTGGEPFTVPNIVEASLALTERHVIGFHTNLTSPKVAELAARVDPARVLGIIASIHLKEIERYHLIDRVVENFWACRDRQIPIEAKVVAYPPLMPAVDRYRKIFGDQGIELKFICFIGRYDEKVYPDAYTDEEVQRFRLDKRTINFYAMRPRLCNAGCNVALVDSKGDMFPCFSIMDETLGNVYQGFGFKKHLTVCPAERCNCSWRHSDPGLYQKAEAATAGMVRGLQARVDHRFRIMRRKRQQKAKAA